MNKDFVIIKSKHREGSKTLADIKSSISKIWRLDEYKFLEMMPTIKYNDKSYRHYVKLLHSKCNRIILKDVYGFLDGHGCICGTGKPRTPITTIKKDFYSVYNKNEWKFLRETDPITRPNGTMHRQILALHKPCNVISSKTVHEFRIMKLKAQCLMCKLGRTNFIIHSNPFKKKIARENKFRIFNGLLK